MLIDGVEMDNDKKRYANWEDLRGYCYLVASVVGRMCVRIFGFSDPVALERADDLGLALQLTNILRDITEDGGLGRIYLPQNELAQFGIEEEALLRGEPALAGKPSSQCKPSAPANCSRPATKSRATSRAAPARACARWPASTKASSTKSRATPGCRCIGAPPSRRPKNCASW